MKLEKLYEQFSPKLLDAIARVMVDEINILRTNAGLSTRTSQQVINAITNKLENIPDYEWMKE